MTLPTGTAADPDDLAAGADERILRRGLRNIGDMIRIKPKPFAIGAAGAMINTTAALFLSYVVGWVVARIAVPAYENGEVVIGTVLLGVAALVATSLVRFSSMCARRIGAGVMQFGVQAHWRRLITRRYLALPVSWHQKHPTGTLLSNANADVEAAARPLAPLPFACGTLFMVVVAMGAFFTIDWAIALVALGMFPALFILNAVFATKMAPRAKRAQELRAEVSAVGHESFDGALVVKAMGQEAAETERFSASATDLRDAMIGVGRLRAAFEPAISGLPEIAVLVALLVGLARYEAGAINLEQLVTVSVMFSILAFPVRAIGWVLGDLPSSVVGRTRIDHVLSATGDMTYGDKRLPASDTPARLEFDAVAYAYPDGHEALHEVTFTVEPGTTVALVGATGSGKSTLAHLAARLVDPTRGTVRLDGEDLRGLDHASIARATALVQQVPFIFDDTVRNNIALDRDGIDDDRIWDALVAAGAEKFTANLDQGLDTEVGERGTSLSGGQRQRLTLARALAGRPRLLVLDDATSAVDPKVESQILAGLKDSSTAASVLVVAYRRATIALADEVVFLEGGRITARGPHTELLRTHQPYADLVTAYERAEAEREFDEEGAA
ncbi:ABC transporter ATP-binding protein [Glycomyces albidus]|jgi:ABC-type multidrug transport system fused ATPase/permease subunit|uniref:ATP-binding cassette domain-containing protein n=1 Tax=Glycomyces albidus TaxID=2656774 RepID=A0A6L5G4C0_9ACTN|nr:ABC transporter ATP-binding protein [Glycomyces albidus]MQM24478.1 ATP-binding cassette domain-containing protein [Glycomyces albidus]